MRSLSSSEEDGSKAGLYSHTPLILLSKDSRVAQVQDNHLKDSHLPG